MNLFNYLMARQGHNTSPRDDLFAYLLGKVPKVVKEVTGVTIHITDVSKEKIISLWLDKESSQDGTPTPDNPIPVEVVEGYENLFDKDDYLQGYAYMGNDKQANANWGIAYIKCNANETFTINYLKPYNAIYIVQTDSNKNFVSNLVRREGEAKYTITSTQDGYIGVSFIWNINATFGNELDTMQITEGTESHPYVPHGNNYVDVTVTGKNLFDKDNISLGYVNADGTLSSDNAYKTSDFISIQPNTAYYKTNTASPRTKYYDSNKQPLNTTTYQDISIGGSAGTFTTPNNARYLRFSFPFTGSAAIDVNSIMINEGSVATPYEPYQESIVPIPLNGNFIAGIDDYKDTLMVDKNGHCWLNKKVGKVVLDGSETNNYLQEFLQGVVRYAVQGVLPLMIHNASRTKILSNYFHFTYSNEIGTGFAYWITGGSIYLYPNQDLDTVEKFKAWLSTHNTEVYYPLEQEELIDLNYTVDLKLFIGENNISNSEDMMMTLKYY